MKKILDSSGKVNDEMKKPKDDQNKDFQENPDRLRNWSFIGEEGMN